MGYLFEKSISPAQIVEAMQNNANYLAKTCKEATDALFASNQRVLNIHDDMYAAEALVQKMGGQFRGTDKSEPWAGTYVDNWRMVSMNAGTIRSMVSSEIYNAYQQGLDIRQPAVIGKMFYLAVLVWSTIGEYTGYAQDEGKR